MFEMSEYSMLSSRQFCLGKINIFHISIHTKEDIYLILDFRRVLNVVNFL